MAEVTINYKDAAIATMNASGITTLQTHGKYCEDDIEVVYVRPSAPSGTKQISITQNGTTIEDVTAYANAEITVDVQGGGGVESVWMDAPEPTDNNLHIWIDLTAPITQKVNLALSGTGNIDWGDGTTETSVSLSGTHTYAQNGVYEIVISWTGTITIPSNNQIVNYYEWETYYYIQRNIIRRIYIPSTITAIGNNKLQNCYALDKATIKCAGTLGDYVFYNCNTLREIVVGEGVTSIGTNCFMGCVSAYKVDVPTTCAEIKGNAFNGVRSHEFHFRATTPPTLSSTTAFSNTESSSKFFVPASAVTAYQEATNWSAYASRIVAEP